jgi:hypothetical protein
MHQAWVTPALFQNLGDAIFLAQPSPLLQKVQSFTPPSGVGQRLPG